VQVERFQASPAGTLRRIDGHDVSTGRRFRHHAFLPHPLPPSIPLNERSYKRVADAHLALGRLDSAVRRLPNPGLLVRPALRREAQSTSALEGTYAPIAEVLEADYVDETKRSAEVREIMNYVGAAEHGLEMIKTKPICVTVIAELQGMLVKGTRGDAYDAGQLRQRQVYIGEQDAGIENSRFVPPPPGHEPVQGVSEWEKWINADDDIPLAVKAALGHYQFETLHPFSDGNGRLGRLIVVLQLVQDGAITYPILNISPWLERRKDRYKDLLLGISETGQYDAWVQFFCEGLAAQASDMVQRIEELLTVREEMLALLRAEKARGVVFEIVEDLIGYPIITPSEAARLHSVTYPPANAAIARLESLGILYEVTGSNYGRIYVCPQVREIVQRP
jgi:Fic family protein